MEAPKLKRLIMNWAVSELDPHSIGMLSWQPLFLYNLLTHYNGLESICMNKNVPFFSYNFGPECSKPISFCAESRPFLWLELFLGEHVIIKKILTFFLNIF